MNLKTLQRSVILKTFTFGVLVAQFLSPAGVAFAAFGDGSPTVSNPSVFTNSDSKAKVDGATGAFTQHIAIDIAPGRNGMQPDLALDYNSQNTDDSIVGYGWSLSIPFIQRVNKTGSQDLFGTNPIYSSSIDGELATTSTSSPTVFRPRVDEGSFRSYTLTNNTWTAYDKNGTRYRFGYSSSTQQYATTSVTRVYKWMLEEIRDTNDNYVKFTYLKDGNEIYPYQIIYTGSGSSDGPATITFATSSRSGHTAATSRSKLRRKSKSSAMNEAQEREVSGACTSVLRSRRSRGGDPICATLGRQARCGALPLVQGKSGAAL